MGLPIPKEPNDIKALIRSVRKRVDDIDDVDSDALAVWSFNRLPKYLWMQWRKELKSKGITWQKFLRIMKLHTIDMIEWALQDSLSWEDLVKKLEYSIEKYSSKRR